MRIKNFILILGCMVITSFIFIILSPTDKSNDSLKSIVTHTHEQLSKLQENLRKWEHKKLEIDTRYLVILGFETSLPSNATHSPKARRRNLGLQVNTIRPSSQSPTSNNDSRPGVASTTETDTMAERITKVPYNGTKVNFTIVTYVHEGQAAAATLLSQNIATRFPNEYLFIYDLGLTELESRSLAAYCNSSKCSVIIYDLSIFPSFLKDKRMHAYRPIVIKDALMRSKNILFMENYIRIRGTSQDLYELLSKATSGVLGRTTSTAVSTRTHPNMFEYFQTNAENFIFLRMVDLDTVFFVDSHFVTQEILLPWIKCALTLECIDPIGAQSNGCQYNKKPHFRYSGCHAYDASAFNIVLGLTWHLNDSKYSLLSDDNTRFYKETLEQATKILENQRRNSSETSEHPFPFTEE